MITLESGPLRLSIAPNLGAGIADFALKGPSGFFFPIMRRGAPDESNASLLGSFFMAPWVNRIRAGKFSFAGRDYAIRTNTSDGMAQHGDVRKRPWRILDRSPVTASLEFNSRDHADTNWPWPFLCRARYALAGGASSGTLTIELSVRNVGADPMPAGCGHHPYFMRRLWSDRDELELRVPVGARYPLDSGCAMGPPKEDDLTRTLRSLAPIPAAPIDDVFVAGRAGEQGAELFWSASGVRLRIIPSANMGHWVVYAPHASAAEPSPLAFIAVEPQTQVNDALNLAQKLGGSAPGQLGTVVLHPDQELVTTCAFAVESSS